MKKKILTVLAIIFVAVIGGVSTVFAMQKQAAVINEIVPSAYEVGVTYEEALQEDKPIIGLFYVDWCTYCRRFMPKLKKLESIYKNDYNLVKINVDDEKNLKMVKDYAIDGFPTVYIIDPKYDNRVHLTSAIYGDVNLIRKECDRYLRIRKILDKNTK